ncbi:acetyltransferase [Mycolicibacillus koreensis]|nr:acetyltransferase [Mycolicibacillus koreensis]
MSARITPLRLEAFDQLPKTARRCVFWEVDPGTLDAGERLADPEFEKEAWLSMVMLEWGSCGQLALPPADALRQRCLGYVFYAPPRVVPRARRFPTGPVSADAVLLTSMAVEPGAQSTGMAARLVAGAVEDLVRRGVRALEAFGRTDAAAADLAGPAGASVGDPQARFVLAGIDECPLQHCIIDAQVLQDAGFVVVAPHRYFPRLRLELDKGLGWKADVEAALERLLENAELTGPVGSGVSGGGR